MSRVPEFSTYVFDVDGTLVDSAVDICGAIQGVFASTILALVKPQARCKHIIFHSSDNYTTNLRLEDAMWGKALILLMK